jgi:hypothetical protein
MSRRLLKELVAQRLRSIIDADALLQLQSELMCAAMAAADEQRGRQLRRMQGYLRRAWLDYGYELGFVLRDVGEAALPPAE